MQLDLCSCEICCVRFDRSTHIPRIIPTCGHTLCSACLTNILADKRKCPFDGTNFSPDLKSIDNFMRNIALLQVMDRLINGEYGTCLVHRQPKNMVCMVDHNQICSECVGSHKDHSIESMNDLKQEAQAKKRSLESLIEESYKQCDDAKTIIKDSKRSLASVIVKEFDRIKDALKKKEREIMLDLDSVFESEDTKLVTATEKDENIRRKYRIKAADLDNINERFFKTLESLKKPLGISNIKTELNRLQDFASNIKDVYTPSFKALSDSIITSIDKMSFQTDVSDMLNVQNSPMSPGNSVIFSPEISVIFSDDEFGPKIGPVRTVEPWSPQITQHVKNEESPELMLLSPEKDVEDIKKVLDIRLQKDFIEIFPKIETGENKSSALNLGALKRLKKAVIEFDEGTISEQHMRALSRTFQYFEKVTQLSIQFNNPTFNDKHLALLRLDSIPGLDKIESVAVDFDEACISDTCTKEFFATIAKMTNIKRIEVFLSETRITDATVQTFALACVPELKKIKELCFELSGTPINDPGILELCQNLMPMAENMKVLKIGLSNTQVSDLAVESLVKDNLKFMNNLQHFSLYLRNTRTTDKSIETLCSSIPIRAMKSMKTFTLNLGNTHISNKSLLSLAKAISPMIALEDLTIDLGRTKIMNTGVISLLTSFAKSAKGLKSLDLNLKKTKITDEALNYFVEHVISSMEALEKFELDLSQTKVGNDLVQKLCKGLGKILKNLKSFTVNLKATKVSGSYIKMILDLVDLDSMLGLRTFNVISPTVWKSYDIQYKIDQIKERLSQRNELEF